MDHKYQIALGGKHQDIGPALTASVNGLMGDLGIAQDRVRFIDLGTEPFSTIDPKAPLVAIFVGDDADHHGDLSFIDKMFEDSITIIPCVSSLGSAATELPSQLAHINAYAMDDPGGISKLSNLILENLRLLRLDRRLFISYRRLESQTIAIQLYESLDAAGFDVFLDVRSVPIAANFQGVLWQRMADSDVVVLLDTPEFTTSIWGEKEFAQANTTNIQILDVLWPASVEAHASAFSEFLRLKLADFEGSDTTGLRARLKTDAVRLIIDRAESLRARALAARHRSLVDNFCDRAGEEGLDVTIQPERYLSLILRSGAKVAVVPTIGVPRADRYQDTENAIRKSGFPAKSIWLLYDERGIVDDWLKHLDWLDEHLPLSSVQVSKCTEKMREGAE